MIAKNLLTGSLLGATVVAAEFALTASVLKGGKDTTPSVDGWGVSYLHGGAGFDLMTLQDDDSAQWCRTANHGLTPCGFGDGATGFASSAGARFPFTGTSTIASGDTVEIPFHVNATAVTFTCEGHLKAQYGDRFMACPGSLVGNPTGHPEDVLVSYIGSLQTVFDGCADVRLIKEKL